MISIRELKERKLVQWAVAYLAAGWLVLQAVDVIGGYFGWAALVGQIATVLLGVGFLAALVLAWYHGEKGRQRVSSMEIGMLTGVLVIAGIGVAFVAPPPRAGLQPGTAAAGAATVGSAAVQPPAEQGSIAVLPFADMSSEGDQEYFSDGIAEELLNVLAQLPELRVAARTSSFAFKGQNVSIDSIARALDVRHVLEGSVRKAGDQVSITAQLIDAETGYHLWSKTYDRKLEDIFAIQDEIARAIVDELQIELGGDRAGGPLAEVETRDPEAHALVLRARQTVLQSSGDPAVILPTAERLFDQAIARDSGYAAAWAGLANVHRIQANYGLIPREPGIERARAEAERALALDPDEGDAHLVLGILAWSRSDASAVEAHFGKAVRANPSDPRTLAFYSSWLAGEGRTEEALRVARRAVELDPLSVAALHTAGGFYRMSRDFERAVRMQERALALSPENPPVHTELAMTRVLLGERDEALRLADRAFELAPGSPLELARIAWVYAYARDFERAVELFRRSLELDPDDPLSQADLANALVMVGGHDEAVELAERAVELAPENSATLIIRAYVYAEADRREEARRALAAIPEDDYLGRAAVHANLGEPDRAFALLEQAVDENTRGLEQLGADWWFDDLRGDPRMDRLLERIGVPEVAGGHTG